MSSWYTMVYPKEDKCTSPTVVGVASISHKSGYGITNVVRMGLRDFCASKTQTICKYIASSTNSVY
jgi:hypothetical protein